VAYSASGKALSGMGSDFRDINNDGRPDIWHTAIEHETFPLYLNRGANNFSDSTAMAGFALATANMSGWGNGIFDFDNDGWKDLFVARSNVVDNISAVYPNRHYTEPNSVFRNMRNGRFEDVSSAAGADFQLEAAHRGVAFGDFDNDGRIDMVVTVLGGPVKLFRNITKNDNHWILLKLVGTKSNRTAIGAQIQITTEDENTQWNQVTTAVGYASASDSRVHFGLGSNRRISELLIRWPSGTKQQVRNVEVDRILNIEEPRL
jgi:enediyne biosynthesis protein E4